MRTGKHKRCLSKKRLINPSTSRETNKSEFELKMLNPNNLIAASLIWLGKGQPVDSILTI